MLNEADYLNK